MSLANYELCLSLRYGCYPAAQTFRLKSAFALLSWEEPTDVFRVHETT